MTFIDCFLEVFLAAPKLFRETNTSCWLVSLFDLRGSGLIQRSPRPWGWSSPRPTPRWPRTSWLAPPTPLRPSRAPGHSSSAETHVSAPGHCLCVCRPARLSFLLSWVTTSCRGAVEFVLFEVTGQLCCSEGGGRVRASAAATREKTEIDLAANHREEDLFLFRSLNWNSLIPFSYKKFFHICLPCLFSPLFCSAWYCCRLSSSNPDCSAILEFANLALLLPPLD